MRSPWLRCALATLLSIKCQQTTALPAVPEGSNNQASITSQSNQNLSSLANTLTLDPLNATITNTSLSAWPPLPFTQAIEGRDGIIIFSESNTRDGSPRQLTIARRMANWLSHRLTTWSSRDFRFAGLFPGSPTDGAIQLTFGYSPHGSAAKADDTLVDVLKSFFAAQISFGCRDMLARYAFALPETLQATGWMRLLLAEDVTPRLPDDVGSEVGKPIVFVIDSSDVFQDGMLEVLSSGTAFTPRDRSRAYALLNHAIAYTQGYRHSPPFSPYRGLDRASGLQIIFRAAALVPMPSLTGYEAAAALTAYKSILQKFGGSTISIDIWRGKNVYANFAISRYVGGGVGNETVLEGGEITMGPWNGTVGGIVRVGNGPEDDEQPQLTRR